MSKFQPGHERLGGKTKGTRNKINRDVTATAARLGVDPFEVLCLFAKGDTKALQLPPKARVSPNQRLAAAIQACKYLYSQKRAVEIKNPDGTGFVVKVEDYTVKNDRPENIPPAKTKAV